MRLTSTLPLFVLLLGCTGSGSDPTGTDPTDPDPTDSPAPTGETDQPLTDVTGEVLDVAGSPIAEAQIRFCRGSLCLNGSTDDQGRFGFERVVAAPTSLEVIGPFGSTYATAFSAVLLEEEVPRHFVVTLLERDPPSPLTADPVWHDVGAGLRIEASSAAIEPPAFVDPATEVWGVFVPEEHHPPLDGLEQVLAVWFVGPFDHHAPDGLPIQIEGTYGLAEGEQVRVRVGDYASSSWLDAGTLTVTGTGLQGDARLPVLSTVVITGP